MSCTNPLYALKLGVINPETGKERIKVLPRTHGTFLDLCQLYGRENLLMLPCGKCQSCVEARSKSWALRCVCEATQYQNNYFITLTYDEKHVTQGLVKKDAQDFIKRLRYYSPGLRYYLVGEFGGKTHRPHFHAILFNCSDLDLKFLYQTEEGNFYSSMLLKHVWPFGMSVVSDVTFKTCAYVARYCEKKLYRNLGEFSIMSRKPGIGYNYFMDNYKDIYKNDYVVTQFGLVKPSRYFDDLLSRIDKSVIDEIKGVRIDNAHISEVSDMLDHGFSFVEELHAYKAELKALKFRALKRNGV